MRMKSTGFIENQNDVITKLVITKQMSLLLLSYLLSKLQMRISSNITAAYTSF